MRKLRKNKFVVLAICVTVVSLAYLGVQKAIDSYVFQTNSDIISEDESDWGDGEERTSESEEGSEGESANGELEESSNEISEEEIDLVLEETENNTEESDAGDDGEGNSNVDGMEKDFDAGAKIYVYITGEVNAPGVVILNEGSRIVDAINAAGGTTIKANVSKVNLVYVLDDGMKVNIPNDNDLKNNPNFEYITMNSGDGERDDYSDETSNAGSSSTGNSSSSSSGSFKNYSIVNINTATQTELETLPGIGPSLALKIINYRKENGKFSSIDEIKNVSGIGDSKFEELKSYITV